VIEDSRSTLLSQFDKLDFQDRKGLIMKALVTFLFVLILISTSMAFGAATLEKAQHRLPPIIYSLELPRSMISGKEYEFVWSVMGYHDSYNINIKIFDSNDNELVSKTLSPIAQKQGQYGWDNVASTEFQYKTNLTININRSQPLIVRFYASPANDPIDQTFLSCIVPSEFGYAAGDTSGRKVKILGLAEPYIYPGVVDSFFNFYVLEDNPYRALIYLTIMAEGPIELPDWIPFSYFQAQNSPLQFPYFVLELKNPNASIASISLTPGEKDVLPQLLFAVASAITPIGAAQSISDIMTLFEKARTQNNDLKYVLLSGIGKNRIVDYLIELRKNSFTDDNPWFVRLTQSNKGLIQVNYENLPLIKGAYIQYIPSIVIE